MPASAEEIFEKLKATQECADIGKVIYSLCVEDILGVLAEKIANNDIDIEKIDNVIISNLVSEAIPCGAKAAETIDWHSTILAGLSSFELFNNIKVVGKKVRVLPATYDVVQYSTTGVAVQSNEVRGLDVPENGTVYKYIMDDVYNIELEDGTIIEVGKFDFELIPTQSKI